MLRTSIPIVRPPSAGIARLNGSLPLMSRPTRATASWPIPSQRLNSCPQCPAKRLSSTISPSTLRHVHRATSSRPSCLFQLRKALWRPYSNRNYRPPHVDQFSHHGGFPKQSIRSSSFRRFRPLNLVLTFATTLAVAVVMYGVYGNSKRKAIARWMQDANPVLCTKYALEEEGEKSLEECFILAEMSRKSCAMGPNQDDPRVELDERAKRELVDKFQAFLTSLSREEVPTDTSWIPDHLIKRIVVRHSADSHTLDLPAPNASAAERQQAIARIAGTLIDGDAECTIPSWAAIMAAAQPHYTPLRWVDHSAPRGDMPSVDEKRLRAIGNILGSAYQVHSVWGIFQSFYLNQLQKRLRRPADRMHIMNEVLYVWASGNTSTRKYKFYELERASGVPW